MPNFERGTSQRLSTSSLPFVGRQSLDGNGTDSNGLRKWGSAPFLDPLQESLLCHVNIRQGLRQV